MYLSEIYLEDTGPQFQTMTMLTELPFADNPQSSPSNGCRTELIWQEHFSVLHR